MVSYQRLFQSLGSWNRKKNIMEVTGTAVTRKTSEDTRGLRLWHGGCEFFLLFKRRGRHCTLPVFSSIQSCLKGRRDIFRMTIYETAFCEDGKQVQWCMWPLLLFFDVKTTAVLEHLWWWYRLIILAFKARVHSQLVLWIHNFHQW